MIEQLRLTNFTVFDELTIDFSPKINVIIGENGTGKTHLLKAAYALCSVSSNLKGTITEGNDEIQAALTAKLLRLFMPLDDKLGKIHRYGASDRAQLEARFILEQGIAAVFNNNSRFVNIGEIHLNEYEYHPVFIPTKEVLSFMKGFTSLYERYELSFDQTL